MYLKLEGSFHVHVRDQCLDLRISLSSEVVISDIYSINVQVADNVGIYIIGDWTPLPHLKSY